jgi:hypothetical protein
MHDDDLLDRCEHFQRALEARDSDAAQELLDSDFALVLVHPEAAVMPRERWLEFLPNYVVYDYDIEEHIVDRAGDIAAILQRVRMRATVLDEDRSGRFIITDVWRHGPSGWRLWRRHSTPLSAGRLLGA